VYLVADLALSVTEQTYPPEEFDMDAVEIDRGNLLQGEDIEEWTNESDQFTPHAATEDGISPRTIPGTAGGAHMTTGLEHDELGRRTEDTDIRVEQVDKRQRKVETAIEREEWTAREFGDGDADVLVLSWGSNEGAIREAMDRLEAEGTSIRLLSVPYLFPRPDLTAAIEETEEVIVVECNATGQFADVIEHDVLARVKRINKYNGVRFDADGLATRITEAIGSDGGSGDSSDGSDERNEASDAETEQEITT
jgi:2-oxoglutarate ferredoxin oxidoreductase subunit alpha